MRSMLQVVGGVAVAGAVAAGSTALTGTGMTTTAGANQFIGGTVSQTVSGASLTGVSYTFADPTTQTQPKGVTFTLAGAGGHTFAMAATGGPFAGGADEWYCSDGGSSGVNTITLAAGTTSVTCITALSTATPAHTATGYYSGLTGMSVTIS